MTDDSNWQAEMRALAEKAADSLLGSCNTLCGLGEDFEAGEADATFCAVLDERVFCCTTCGWWEEQPAHDHPDSGEWVCEGCFEEAGGEPE